MSAVEPRTFSSKLLPYAQALIRAGYSIHPKWTAAQIVGCAQNLVPAHKLALQAGRDAAWKRMRNGEGIIYLVQLVEHPDIVKMGYGLDLEKRMKTLPRDCGYAVRLIRSAPGSFYDERALHERLWRYRWKGTYRREFYPARAIYNLSPMLPQGFMIGLASILGARNGS